MDNLDLPIGLAFALRHNGLMNDETHFVITHKTKSGHSRQHIKRTVDGDGHNGQLQLVGQLKSAFAENAHVACKRA